MLTGRLGGRGDPLLDLVQHGRITAWTGQMRPRSGLQAGWRRSGGLLGLQLPYHVQGVLDMLADVGHRAEDVPDRAGPVNDIGNPTRQQAQHGRHAIALAHPATLVAGQREGQLMPAGKRGVPADRVRTDADHLGAGAGEYLVAVPECACLGRAAAGLVPGVEVQDDHPLAEPVMEPDQLTGLRGEREVRGLVTDLDAACHAVPAFLRSGQRTTVPLGKRIPQGNGSPSTRSIVGVLARRSLAVVNLSARPGVLYAGDSHDACDSGDSGGLVNNGDIRPRALRGAITSSAAPGAAVHRLRLDGAVTGSAVTAYDPLASAAI